MKESIVNLIEKIKKNKRSIFYIVVIGGSIIFISILLFIDNNDIAQKAQNAVRNEASDIKARNNVDTTVKNYKFDNFSDPSTSKLDVYTINKVTDTQIKQFADNLDMNISDDIPELKLIKYKDKNNNYISLSNNKTTLIVDNSNNPKLANFTRDNTLLKLSSIFGIDMSGYVLNTTALNQDSSTNYQYKYKIKSYDMLTDFNGEWTLNVRISSNLNLTEIVWDVTVPQSAGLYSLKTLSYVKDNFNKVDKGIYPNFEVKSSIQGQENFKDVEAFDGSIEITNVDIAYLWTTDNSTYIVPVYRFKAKFTYTSGKVTDGVIIVNAVEI